MVVNGIYSNGARVDITAQSVISNSNSSVIQFSTTTPGAFTAQSPGTSVVSAAYGTLSSSGISIVVFDPNQEVDFTATITATTTSGVAPLPIFFDALQTNLPSGTKHDAYYLWDFDDPNSSHPSAVGFCASHVYEAEGTYNVTLLVLDAASNVGAAEVRVTVDSFSGTTYYVSTSGNDANSGTSQAQPFRTFDHAMSEMDDALGSSPTAVRVLFRSGQSFSTSNGAGFHGTKIGAPAIIGSYGSGAAPILQHPAGSAPFAFFSFNEGCEGFRVMDLELRGGFNYSSGSGSAPHGIATYDAEDILMLRLDASGLNSGYEGAGHGNDRIAIFDSSFTSCDAYGGILAGSRLAIVGSEFARALHEHSLRFGGCQKGVISGNLLYEGSKHVLKMHALGLETEGLATHDVVISGNIFRGHGWIVQMAPQNNDSNPNEEIYDVIFERNLVLPKAAGSTGTPTTGVVVIGHHMTFRNNIFVADPSQGGYMGISLSYHEGRAIPHPTHMRILHNTYYNGAVDTQWNDMVLLSVNTTRAHDLQVKGNILHARDGGFGSAIVSLPSGYSLSELDDADNLIYMDDNDTYITQGGNELTISEAAALGHGSGCIANDPRLVDPADLDFTLESDSPAADAGAFLPGVFDDLQGNLRPQTGGVSIGACQIPDAGTP